MVKVRKHSEDIRQFILASIEKHPLDLAKVVAESFSISRQAVNRHIQALIEKNFIQIEGSSRNPYYFLVSETCFKQEYLLDKSLAEDQVWRNDISSLFNGLSKNVIDILHYGFTEIFNNAIDHSGGHVIEVSIKQTAIYFEIKIADNGEGIFKKIKAALNLDDERHAVLELAKGKLTTAPSHHSGEGIFFTSRVFDEFHIFSGGVCFSHLFDSGEDWIQEYQGKGQGTRVFMRLHKKAEQTLKSVFDQFASGDDFSFSKTVVPVELAQYGDDALMSRSQAKRVLIRIEKFKTVIFDFEGVESVGQAFADEIFRVFANQHPTIELSAINANPDVQAMISRALAAR